MNKTITVTLSGLIFHIDEEAYQRLKRYLDDIRQCLDANVNQDEVMRDIEASIAEKFTGLITPGKQVITMADVEELIKIMGQAKDFSDEPADKGERSRTSASNIGRKLYRNGDDMIIAGVCSGLGAFFGMDAIIFRLIFILSIFLGGTGIIIYIILWIVMPLAKSSAQKLEMQGEPITLAKIEELAKEKVKAAQASVDYSFLRRLLELPVLVVKAVFQAIKKIFPVLGSLIGLFIILGCALLLAGLTFLATVLAFHLNSPLLISDLPIQELAGSRSYYIAIASAYFFILMPLLFAINIGASLMKRKSTFSILSSGTMLGIWLIAIMGLGFSALDLAPKISDNINSQNQEAKSLSRDIEAGEFDSIKAGGNYRIRLITAEKTRIVAHGLLTDIERIRTEISGNELEISSDQQKGICFFCSFRAVELDVYAPRISAIRADGASRFSWDNMKADRMEISADGISQISGKKMEIKDLAIDIDGSARCNLAGSSSILNLALNGAGSFNSDTLDSDIIKIEMDGMGRAEISGQVRALEISADGASRLSAFGLKAQGADVEADGSSRVEISASSALKAKADGAAHIKYYGNPEVENLGADGASRIEAAD